jgi:peptidoglycan/xylan/chitin deacetylase (PgdA/CDA1 family)
MGAFLLGLLLLGLAGAQSPKLRPPAEPTAGARGRADARVRVAFTFDDLPVHAALPPGVGRIDIARSILAALRAHHVPPTYGFVNAKGLDESPANRDVLRMWREAGHRLGNHTFSHMDLDANTVDAFERDIIDNEAVLRAYMGDEGWRWLRFPYLREGEVPEKRLAIATFLEHRGYRIAEVTISFDDYAYNDPYARCLAKNDHASVEWMKKSYLERAAAAVSASRESANLVYGRDIPHVMLLHFGAFDAVMLPALLAALEKGKARFATLEEAQGDPAYAPRPDVPCPPGRTLLGRMMEAKGIVVPNTADDALARLAQLCR